jgi:CBS domain-containing protein
VSGSNTRVFLARLAGVPVFDPTGDQVGKIRDIIVALNTGLKPPRVLGLLVEVPPRRRIFLPITRVHSFSANQVVVSGVINMRRFVKRPMETLVIGELLDRTVTLKEDHSLVTVVDVGIEQNRRQDWDVTQLYVKRGGGFRRRGESLIVDWGDAIGLSVASPTQGAEAVLARIDSLRPADIAHMLQELPESRRQQIAASLTDSRLADVLEELPEEDQVEILSQLDLDRAADILEEMSPDDATDLIGELEPAQAARLLQRMEPEDAEDIRRLLSYDERTAGGLMTTEPVILGPDATIAEALAAVRSIDLSPSLASQVYVVRPPLESPTGRYLGTAHFQRLLREPPSQLVSGVVDSELEAIEPDTPLGQVARYFATYNLVAAPVVDDNDHLLGAVTVDDVLDHMLPEDWREQPLDTGEDDVVIGHG